MSKKNSLTVREFDKACRELAPEFFVFDSVDQKNRVMEHTDHYSTYTKMAACMYPANITFTADNGDYFNITSIKDITWEETDIGVYVDITCGDRRKNGEDGADKTYTIYVV